MNKAITDGLLLMPPPFAAGLNLWSRDNGTPGSGTYAGQSNASFVPADQDFGGCLELQKVQTVQKLRSMAQIPYQPGLYLRVTARVKAIAGALPAVRIAGWAGNASGGNVSSVAQVGPDVPLTSYGEVVTVAAIIGSGNRQGVDLVWGTQPVYGHLGLDLTGASGGVVRIDDIVIEDVTEVFHRKLMDWVDVRDYGALGDGVTDDTDAFERADTAAAGRTVLVSAGTYYLGSNVTFESRVRFEGTLVMPPAARLACTRNFDLDTYAAAFGGELAGFRKALQALFFFTDHVALDLSGRRIDLPGPVDVAAVVGITAFSSRRVLTNGQLNAVAGPEWTPDTATSVGTYAPGQPLLLTNVANVANIAVGARVSANGVGREVYVRSKNVGAGTIELSQPLWGAAGTRTFTFERYKYLLDFSGFSALSRFEITDTELQCNGIGSGILLATSGLTFRLADSVVNRPRDRGLTSTGTGCQGMFIDQCQFLSNEQALDAQFRTTIAVNVNANDVKIRDNRIVRFAHFAVMNGSGHLILGNHFFQGDDAAVGVRRAGLIFTQTNVATTVTGNYVDNCFIEWGHEHDPEPTFSNEFSFGGLNVNNNVFIASYVAPWFLWLVIAPRGPGHFINGLSVTGNAFRVFNATIDRVEGVDATYAELDYARFRNIRFDANSFNSVTQATISPVTIEHQQNSVADTWVVDGAAFLPFRPWARNVQSVVIEGPMLNAAGAAQSAMPYVQVEQGTFRNVVFLRWPTPVRGTAHVTLRCDNPN